MQCGTLVLLETDCITFSMRITTCFLFRQLVLNLSAHRNHLGILENTDVLVSSPDWNNWSGIRPGFRLLKARVCSQDIHHWSTPFLSDSFESWKNPLSHTLFSLYCKTNSTLWYSCYLLWFDNSKQQFFNASLISYNRYSEKCLRASDLP